MMKNFKKILISALCLIPLTAASCDDYAPYLPADRIESVAPQSTVDHVNSLPYALNDSGPAVAAFQIVAADRGWTQADIDAWTPFVRNVMARESRFCPGAIYGMNAQADCTPTGRPKGSAAGFGQILMRVNGSWLCPQEGLCDRWAVVSSPYASMTALVATVERGGRGPWCYSSRLRNGSVCRSAP